MSAPISPPGGAPVRHPSPWYGAGCSRSDTARSPPPPDGSRLPSTSLRRLGQPLLSDVVGMAGSDRSSVGKGIVMTAALTPTDRDLRTLAGIVGTCRDDLPRSEERRVGT